MNESELLFTEALRCDRLSLYLNKDKKLENPTASFIAQALRQRIDGVPLDYILGKTEFMGLEFRLNQDVLIPRPETELLVEKIIEIARGRQAGRAAAKILDLGTGSGNIAIALAKNLRFATIDATDISSAALKVAQKNARLHRVQDRVKFFLSDLFANVKLKPKSYEYIASNPPYISAWNLADLPCEVRREPRIALDGGFDGLDFYRRIISRAGGYLIAGGYLVLEIGFNQRYDVVRQFQDQGGYEIIEIVKDYSGIDRIVAARLKK